MSTASTTLETAWTTYVWNHATIKAISPIYYLRDITKESELELTALMYQQQINGWVCRIAKTEVWIGLQVLEEQFTIDVDYYRQQDTNGAAWTATRNALETLQTQVRTVLGETWNYTVGSWEPQDKPAEITETNIQETPCWKGSFQFTAKI